MQEGILVIDKEANQTSRDVVNQVSKLLGTKKIGHTGTLDPLATGVLVLCVGKATKACELLTAMKKEYFATVLLGTETDTLDITGKILKQEPVSVTKQQIETVLASFIGSYEQEVPLYSAVHVKGKRLYEYARNQEEVIPPKRTVTIEAIQMKGDIEINETGVFFSFLCTVSKGTYIRSLIRDISHKLHTIGCMQALRRTRQGQFTVEKSQTIASLHQSIHMLPLLPYLEGKQVMVDSIMEKQIRNGSLLPYQGTSPIIYSNQQQQLLAIYIQYQKDPTKLKPWKTFY